MVDRTGQDNPESRITLDCERWEALLADKMDLPEGDPGLLTAEEEAAFVEHSLRCPGCADLLERARQGREWLRLLEGRTPQAPVHLLSKILAKTQGAGREADYAIGTGAVASLPGHGRWGIPFLPASGAQAAAARGAHNARMLMTAGMAFFSVALTLSVVGVRFSSVHAAELRPQAVQANVSRSFYGTKKQVISFYENLRLVYEVESKMRDLRRDSEAAPTVKTPPAARTPQPADKGAPAGKAPTGASHNAPRTTGGHAAADPQVLHGWPLAVEYLPSSTPARVRPVSSLTRGDKDVSTEASAVSPDAISGATSKERNRT